MDETKVGILTMFWLYSNVKSSTGLDNCRKEDGMRKGGTIGLLSGKWYEVLWYEAVSMEAGNAGITWSVCTAGGATEFQDTELTQ